MCFVKDHGVQGSLPRTSRRIPWIKVIMQGKLFQRCTHLLYCSLLSLGGNANTRRMLQPDMGSIFHLKKSMNYSGQKTIMRIIKIFEIQCFYPPRILDKHWCNGSCLQIPHRENWFLYVRRVYAAAINFPCIITLPWMIETHLIEIQV